MSSIGSCHCATRRGLGPKGARAEASEAKQSPGVFFVDYSIRLINNMFFCFWGDEQDRELSLRAKRSNPQMFFVDYSMRLIDDMFFVSGASGTACLCGLAAG